MLSVVIKLIEYSTEHEQSILIKLRLNKVFFFVVSVQVPILVHSSKLEANLKILELNYHVSFSGNCKICNYRSYCLWRIAKLEFENKYFKNSDVENKLKATPSLQTIFKTIFSRAIFLKQLPIALDFFLGICSSKSRLISVESVFGCFRKQIGISRSF